jgi:hypothetical protein
MNLYQYARNRLLISLDPHGTAVVLFGGGFKIAGVPTGDFFVPPGFKAAAKQYDGRIFPGVNLGMPEAAKWFSGYGGEVKKAEAWLKKLSAWEKCEVRIAGYSSGCSATLALAQKVASNPEQYGVPSGGLVEVVFYDFNWGAAHLKDYNKVLGDDFSKPKGRGVAKNMDIEHVTSDGWVFPPGVTTTIYRRGLLGEEYAIPLLGEPGVDWTKRLWKEFRGRQPKAGDYILYGPLLANTSGYWTYKYKNQAWLRFTDDAEMDHFSLGLRGITVADLSYRLGMTSKWPGRIE